MNKDIDYVTIKFKSNTAYPTTNCRLLKLYISTCAQDVTWNQFEDFIEEIDPTVKVSLKINNKNDCSFGKIREIIQKILSLNLVRLQIPPIFESSKINETDYFFLKISSLKHLIEYSGPTKNNIEFKMVNICDKNREDFIKILLGEHECIEEINSALKESSCYYLLNSISIKEY